MPRDASSSEKRSKASCQSPTVVAMSVSPTRIGNQDNFRPSHPIIVKSGRNVEPFVASINGFSAVNEHSKSYLSGLICVETVSTEIADVNPRERMIFASNSVFGETPKFMDLGLSPSHTRDKCKSVIGPTTRAEGWLDHSYWLLSWNRIAEVIEERVVEAKSYGDYIKNS